MFRNWSWTEGGWGGGSKRQKTCSTCECSWRRVDWARPGRPAPPSPGSFRPGPRALSAWSPGRPRTAPWNNTWLKTSKTRCTKRQEWAPAKHLSFDKLRFVSYFPCVPFVGTFEWNFQVLRAPWNNTIKTFHDLICGLSGMEKHSSLVPWST